MSPPFVSIDREKDRSVTSGSDHVHLHLDKPRMTRLFRVSHRFFLGPWQNQQNEDHMVNHASLSGQLSQSSPPTPGHTVFGFAQGNLRICPRTKLLACPHLRNKDKELDVKVVQPGTLPANKIFFMPFTRVRLWNATTHLPIKIRTAEDCVQFMVAVAYKLLLNTDFSLIMCSVDLHMMQR